MNLSINLGSWNSIFAVPSEVVDKHIKLAGAAQLKVLLFILRNAGKNISTGDIAIGLSMTELDVKDSMQYWIETNIISFKENTIIPNDSKSYAEPVDPKNENIINPPQDNVCQDQKDVESLKQKRQPSRPQKPDVAFVAQRINDCPEISFLMQEAQIILSRPISNGDSATLLMLHDTDGLPVDIIIMLMQYAVSIGKGNMKYIEKIAISWAQEEIDTIEKAENKIRTLENYRKSWNSLEKIIGIEHRSPSSKEDEAANRWINIWQIPEDLIKEAYDRCVNSKGKYILNYMDGIIKRWHDSGIKTLKQALEEDKYKKPRYGQKQDSEFTSYNIDEYERNYMYI